MEMVLLFSLQSSTTGSISGFLKFNLKKIFILGLEYTEQEDGYNVKDAIFKKRRLKLHLLLTHYI